MLPESSTGRRWFELCGQVLVIYSVVVFYLEAELVSRGSHHVGSSFWIWNERALLILFCGEYAFRWAHAHNRLRYPFTLLAAIDMIAIVPSLIGLTVGLRTLKLVRLLPLLWMLKLYRYDDALQRVMHGFRRVSRELSVVGFVTTIVLIASSMAIYELEREAQPDKFGHLSDGLWWSFVTLTTVGYGDIYPITAAGRLVAGGTMLVGIGVLGTFISLIGSSFLTSMRHDGTHLELDSPTLPLADQGSPPDTYRRAG